MTGHSPECDCEKLCQRLNLGSFAYREIAEELGSDDPAVIDPIWRARCDERIAAHRPPSVGMLTALVVLAQPDRLNAAA